MLWQHNVPSLREAPTATAHPESNKPTPQATHGDFSPSPHFSTVLCCGDVFIRPPQIAAFFGLEISGLILPVRYRRGGDVYSLLFLSVASPMSSRAE